MRRFYLSAVCFLTTLSVLFSLNQKYKNTLYKHLIRKGHVQRWNKPFLSRFGLINSIKKRETTTAHSAGGWPPFCVFWFLLMPTLALPHKNTWWTCPCKHVLCMSPCFYLLLSFIFLSFFFFLLFSLCWPFCKGLLSFRKQRCTRASFTREFSSYFLLYRTK